MIFCAGFHQGLVDLDETDDDNNWEKKENLKCLLRCQLWHMLEVAWFYHAAFHQGTKMQTWVYHSTLPGSLGWRYAWSMTSDHSGRYPQGTFKVLPYISLDFWFKLMSDPLWALHTGIPCQGIPLFQNMPRLLFWRTDTAGVRNLNWQVSTH